MAATGGDFFMHEWMDLSDVPFDALLLLERVQIGWLPRWSALPRPELAIALRGAPLCRMVPAPQVSGDLALAGPVAGCDRARLTRRSQWARAARG